MTAPLLAVEKLEVVYQRAITAMQGVSLARERRPDRRASSAPTAPARPRLLRAISGFLGLDDARVTEGTILFKGKRIENRRRTRSRGSASCWCPSATRCFPNLTVAENLLRRRRRGVGAAERRRREDAGLQFFPAAGELRHRIGGLLSGGERQMLALGSALVCKPELLLVDELSLGLAPVVVEDLMQRLVQIRNELGITIVIVEQSAAVALEIADYGYVLENGRIVLDGDGERLRGHADIQEFYLGQASGEAPQLSRRQAISPQPEMVWLSSRSTT